MKTLNEGFKLKTGSVFPSLGLGTMMLNGDTCIQTIKRATELGYRFIDTALSYYNEAEVGKAVRECKIPRDQLFVETKLWNMGSPAIFKYGKEAVRQKTVEVVERQLSAIGLDYIDSMLIHFPHPGDPAVNLVCSDEVQWSVLEEYYKAGKIKHIGVSNYEIRHFEELKKTAEILPMINQIEFHVGYQQSELVDYCHANGIVVEAYKPLGQGKVFNVEEIQTVAQKYNKNVSQLCLRYCLQKEVLAIPKTSSAVRLAENIDIFDFEISAADMAKLDSISLPPVVSETPVRFF